MVVDKQMTAMQMLFAWRGTVMVRIWPQVFFVGLLAISVTAAEELRPGLLPTLELAPYSLIGLVLSIFLGFRNNVCYDRWWEGRKQWGALVGHSRALARIAPAFLDRDSSRRERILFHIAGFALALVARLREKDQAAALRPFLTAEETALLDGAANIPGLALTAISRDLAHAQREGEISDQMLHILEGHVEGLNAVQTACDRLASSPPPFTYSLILHRTCWIFCVLAPFGLAGAAGWMSPFFSLLLAYAFFGLDALGDELQLPFGEAPNHLPLDAMARAIEIEVLQAAGVEKLPAPWAAVDDILS